LTAEESDRALFSALVDEHQSYLYSFVLGMVGNRDDAEDITAKAFLKAYLAFKSFKRNCSFKTWVTTVAINLVKNHRRDKHPASSIEAESEQIGFEPMDVSISPEDTTMRCENTNAIKHAISQLPINYRTFIVLKYLQDLSYEEIADTTGVPVTTVRNRIHQGKEILKELFKKNGVSAPTEDGYEIV
jgi:RNA polymerase sigma-70 factor (ECF subfamily)